MNRVMRFIMVLLVMLLVGSTSAFADRGGSGGHGGSSGGRTWYSGGYSGGNVSHGGGHVSHGGGHVNYGVYVGPGWWGPYPYYPYYYPYYPYYYPYYQQPPVVVEQAPEIYVQPAPAPQETQYWYYCPDPQGYYPDVNRCPKGWLKVVPPEKPPGGEE